MLQSSDSLPHLAAGPGGADTGSECSHVFAELLAGGFLGGLRLSLRDRPGACSTVGTLLRDSCAPGP